MPGTGNWAAACSQWLHSDGPPFLLCKHHCQVLHACRQMFAPLHAWTSRAILACPKPPVLTILWSDAVCTCIYQAPLESRGSSGHIWTGSGLSAKPLTPSALFTPATSVVALQARLSFGSRAMLQPQASEKSQREWLNKAFILVCRHQGHLEPTSQQQR